MITINAGQSTSFPRIADAIEAAKAYDQLLLGKHTVKGVCSGGQPATAGFVVLISMYSAMRLNSSANLNLTLMFPFS